MIVRTTAHKKLQLVMMIKDSDTIHDRKDQKSKIKIKTSAVVEMRDPSYRLSRGAMNPWSTSMYDDETKGPREDQPPFCPYGLFHHPTQYAPRFNPRSLKSKGLYLCASIVEMVDGDRGESRGGCLMVWSSNSGHMSEIGAS